MHTFVPDSNFFLQCQDYQSVDWRLATDESKVVIAVPRAVQREIDRLKDGGNSRRASRARKANGLFAQVIDAVGDQLTVETQGILISVRLLVQRARQDEFPDLDLHNADDQIVAEALLLQRDRTGDVVTFLSNDTAALVTARAHDLPYLRPPSQWILAPEKDERDKTIEELRRKVERLSSQLPELAFTVLDYPLARIEREITMFPELTETEIDGLVGEIAARCPMETQFHQEAPPRFEDPVFNRISSILSSLEKWEPANAREINEYQSRAYPQWLRQIRTELASIESRFNKGALTSFALAVENVGQQPARNLLISCAIEGAFLFGVPARRKDGKQFLDEVPLLTSPPQAPTGKYVSIVERFAAVTAFAQVARTIPDNSVFDLTGAWLKESRDPNHLYWKPSRPSEVSNEWALECEEFRHQHVPLSIMIDFKPTVPTHGTFNGAIRCHGHAANLPDRAELVIPIRITVLRGETAERVRQEFFRFD